MHLLCQLKFITYTCASFATEMFLNKLGFLTTLTIIMLLLSLHSKNYLVCAIINTMCCLSMCYETTLLCTCRYRHKLHREPWYGIWWVCLLQYTHLLFTSMSVLDCPLLPNADGSRVLVSLHTTESQTYALKCMETSRFTCIIISTHTYIHTRTYRYT